MKSFVVALALVVLGCGTSHGGSDAGRDGGGLVTDCDPRHALCDEPPIECPPGHTVTIEGSCWGPCVPDIECAPIACDPTSSDVQCPAGWGCVGGGACAFPN